MLGQLIGTACLLRLVDFSFNHLDGASIEEKYKGERLIGAER